MCKASVMAGIAVIGLIATGAVAWAAQTHDGAIPDFGANRSAWIKTTNLWVDPPPGTPGLGPLHPDPAHPFRTRGVDAQGRDDSGSGRVGDWHDPNLKPRAADQVKTWGALEAKGEIQVTASSGCLPAGVPGVHMINEPLYIVQTPKEVTMLWQRGPYVRHILMNVPHSKNLEPTWFGESVGHYEGDTLVIDTIGFKPGAQIDHFGVTNSAKLHVVERIRMVDVPHRAGRRGAEPAQAAGAPATDKELQVVFRVDDPDTYNHPWTGMMRYRHVAGSLTESICAENNMDYFTGKLYPVPSAAKADF